MTKEYFTSEDNWNPNLKCLYNKSCESKDEGLDTVEKLKEFVKKNGKKNGTINYESKISEMHRYIVDSEKKKTTILGF